MSLVYRLLPVPAVRKRITDSVPWIKALSECDIAGDVRGGDSFSDIYGIKRFVFGFIAAATVLLVHGKLVQFPQTYGPYKSLLSRILARILLRNSTTIVARDKHSREVASNLAGSAKQVKLSPDVAFSLEAVRPSQIALDPPEDSLPSGEIIGINVNGLMYNGGYTRSNMFGLKLDYPEYLREVVSSLARSLRLPHLARPPHLCSDRRCRERQRGMHHPACFAAAGSSRPGQHRFRRV